MQTIEQPRKFLPTSQLDDLSSIDGGAEFANHNFRRHHPDSLELSQSAKILLNQTQESNFERKPDPSELIFIDDEGMETLGDKKFQTRCPSQLDLRPQQTNSNVFRSARDSPPESYSQLLNDLVEDEFELQADNGKKIELNLAGEVSLI